MAAASTVDFVHEIEHRARTSGWDVGTYDITNFNIVPSTTGTAAIIKKLFLKYGHIPVGNLKAACEDCPTSSKKEVRTTQNNEQMGFCIIMKPNGAWPLITMNSCSTRLFMRLSSSK